MSYCTIDGFECQPSRPSTSLSVLCALCASCGTFLLVASALKEISSVANYAATTTRPLVTVSNGLNTFTTPSSSMQKHYEVRSSTQTHAAAHSEAEAVYSVPLAPTQRGSFMAAVGVVFVVVAGIAGYGSRRENSSIALMGAAGTRPTLAETKLNFLKLCNSSLPGMYNQPLQELLSQHHLIRYNTKYAYDEVFALGIVTVLRQLLEGLGESESQRVQTAYFGALDDDVSKFQSDAATLEEWAKTKGKEAGLKLDGGDAEASKLQAIAERVAEGNFLYTKFFSIGLFQLLQQSGLTDPESFTGIIASMNLSKDRVTSDLKIYKDLLKKLEMAKDMKDQFIERERKKQEERMAAKAKAEAPAAEPAAAETSA